MDDITGRAGLTDVVIATRGTGTRSETPREYETLTAADMQRLADGESVVVGRDLPPFLAVSKGVHEIRSLRRQISREAEVLQARPRVVAG